MVVRGWGRVQVCGHVLVVGGGSGAILGPTWTWSTSLCEYVEWTE